MAKRISSEEAEAKMLSVGLQPLEPYVNAISKWRCKCLICNNQVISTYNRVQQGAACSICAYKAGGEKIRLSEEEAQEKLKKYNLEALEPYLKSDTPWRCRCLLCNQIVFPKLKNLQQGDGGCYSCGMKKAGLKNSMSQEDALNVIHDAGFEALEPYKNALSKWKLRHKACGAIVYPKLNSIKNNDAGGCAVCSGHQVEVGFNDLRTTNPTLSLEAFGWDPSKVTQGSNQKKEWICQLKHHWLAKVSDRATKESGCPYCTGKRVLVGFNDLLTVYPQVGVQALDWDPTTVTAGSVKKLKWRCDDGHIWNATVLGRTQGYGCPTCASSGFDPNKDSYLYFLSHPNWQMYQIGITNYAGQRIKSHEKLGWEVIEIRGPMDGLVVREWETAILRMLKAKGADLSNSKIAGKFDGYSEAWSKSTFEVKSIKELMRLTEEYEGE
jgi:hypothetical protein